MSRATGPTDPSVEDGCDAETLDGAVSRATGPTDRVAGAPISWGVCEVPGWGRELPRERVLAEMRDLGLGATELGPGGYLPSDPDELRALLDEHGLRLLAGFVPVVLHRPEARSSSLGTTAAVSRRLAALGAEVLVVAAASGEAGYDRRPELDGAGWASIADMLDEMAEVAASDDLALTVHPHAGTMIESATEVEQLLDRTSAELCVDSGHLVLGGADPLAVVRQAGGRVRHVHLKDVDAALARAVQEHRIDYMEAVRRGLFRPLGRGDAPVGAMVEWLEQAGYSHWYVLEQDVALADPPRPDEPEPDPARDVATSLEFLSTTIRQQQPLGGENVQP